jgi:transposase InsO family protein
MDAERDGSRKGTKAGGPGAPGPPAAARPRAHRGPYDEQVREALLAELARSEESVERFARRHGINPSTIYAWRNSSRTKGRRRGSLGRGSRQCSFEERKAAVEEFAKSGMTQCDFSRLYGVTENTLSKWLRRYHEEGPRGLERRPSSRRGRTSKAGLKPAVREEIVSVQRRFPDFGLRKVRDFLWRFSGLLVSAGSIRKVRSQEGIAPPPPPRRRRAQAAPRRFERARPGELWQSDITSYLLARESRRVYLTVFLDDHSRYVVSWALALQQRHDLVIEALLDGCARFGKPREVLTDQGRQYFAWRGKSAFEKVLEREGIRHVVARAHHPQTVGKCERLWETVSREFWERARPQELSEARERLSHFFAHYNHFRPHQGLGGLVPADRFFGAEAEVRRALERAMSRNELALAVGEKPRKPVFLVGQIGERQVSLHGEQGRLVVQTSDGRREDLSYEELGAPVASPKQQEIADERDDDHEQGSGERDGDSGGGEASPPLGEEASLPPLAHGAGTGAGAVGIGERGGEEEGARGVRGDSRVVAGPDEPPGGGRPAGGGADPGLAALAAGAGGDGGGTAASAQSAEVDRDAPPGAGPEGASKASRPTAEGARGEPEPGGSAAGTAGEPGEAGGGGEPEPAGAGAGQKGAGEAGPSESGQASGCATDGDGSGEVSGGDSPRDSA